MPSAADPDFRAAFNRMDTNHDGKLTPDEYFESSGDLPWSITADAVVYRYDTEESVFLDYDKPDAGGTDKGIEINSAAAPANAQPLSLTLDTNGDGQVQFSEYEAQQLRDLKARFAAIDRDSDGLLSPEELTLKPMDFSGVRSAVTVSADGRITMGLPAPPQPGERSRVASADVNGDGIVTLEEFLAAR
jgi:Ca2+-binding EF-hand superfamily protein